MSKNVDPLLAKFAAKADRVEKPIPVDVPDVGRVYVRKRLMHERDEADLAESEGNFDVVCVNVARLLCNEDGTRKQPDEIVAFAKVFMRMPIDDVVLIGNAADGYAKEDAPGN